MSAESGKDEAGPPAGRGRGNEYDEGEDWEKGDTGTVMVAEWFAEKEDMV